MVASKRAARFFGKFCARTQPAKAARHEQEQDYLKPSDLDCGKNPR